MKRKSEYHVITTKLNRINNLIKFMQEYGLLDRYELPFFNLLIMNINKKNL